MSCNTPNIGVFFYAENGECMISKGWENLNLGR